MFRVSGEGENVKGVLSVHDFRAVGEVVSAEEGYVPLEITDPVVVIDSRDVHGGELFIALKGEKTDGHCYIAGVFEKGASWAMVKREWYEAQGSAGPPAGKGFIVVEDTVEGLQKLSHLYRNTFAIPVVAVGGSNGKTTTKEMAASVLETGFKVQMSRGNRNNHLGVPLTLFQLRHDTGIAVVEMGINHPEEMDLLTAIGEPTHALLTNIGHEHLEFLFDLDGVERAELKLFEDLERRGGTIFVNFDDPRLQAAGTAVAGSISYGTVESSAHICWSRDVVVEPDGRVSFALCSASGTEKVTLNFTGRHNVINAVAAAAVGLHFGLSIRQVREGLERLVPAAGWKRLEVVDAAGIRILNDTYNANSDSMRLAIDALCDMQCSGKRIAVLGDMLELGAASEVEHETIGRYIQQSTVDILLSYGEKARLICSEAPGCCRGHFESREKLIEALLGVVDAGDAVLFKGSRGMKLEQVVEALLNARTITR